MVDDRSVAFGLLLTLSFRLRLRVVEIVSDVAESLVWRVRRDFSFVQRYQYREDRAHQLQEGAPTCNSTLRSRSRSRWSRPVKLLTYIAVSK